MQAIYFDMDGTLTDLYNVKNWEVRLRKEDVFPYFIAKPLCDMDELADILTRFTDLGITIGVISWGSMRGTTEYNREVKAIKKDWLNRHLPNCFTEIHVIKYGTAKHTVAKIKDSILVDDSLFVREKWEKKNGKTIDASDPIVMLEELRALLEEMEG